MNTEKRPVLCTTLYRKPMQPSHFDGILHQFCHWIFSHGFHQKIRFKRNFKKRPTSDSVWRRAVRCIAGADWQADVAPLLKNHRLTHIEHRWALQIALVTRRCIQRSAPLALCKKLTFTDHSHRTRGSGNSLRPFRPSSRPGTLSFSNRAPFFGTICHQAFNKHPPLHLLSTTI